MVIGTIGLLQVKEFRFSHSDSASQKIFEQQGRNYRRMPESFDAPPHISKHDRTRFVLPYLFVYQDIVIIKISICRKASVFC